MSIENSGTLSKISFSTEQLDSFFRLVDLSFNEFPDSSRLIRSSARSHHGLSIFVVEQLRSPWIESMKHFSQNDLVQQWFSPSNEDDANNGLRSLWPEMTIFKDSQVNQKNSKGIVWFFLVPFDCLFQWDSFDHGEDSFQSKHGSADDRLRLRSERLGQIDVPSVFDQSMSQSWRKEDRLLGLWHRAKWVHAEWLDLGDRRSSWTSLRSFRFAFAKADEIVLSRQHSSHWTTHRSLFELRSFGLSFDRRGQNRFPPGEHDGMGFRSGEDGRCLDFDVCLFR